MVIITNKSIEPFSLWDIEGMGKEVGLQLDIKEPFSIDNYPGYQNRRGAGKRAAKRFPCDDAVLYGLRPLKDTAEKEDAKQ